MAWIIAISTFSGFSLVLWALVGLVRAVCELIMSFFHVVRWHHPEKKDVYPWSIHHSQVAAIVAAHNEEISIGRTLQALIRIMPSAHVFVGSDGSNDGTADIARNFGCNVVELSPNRGKAGVIAYIAEFFDLINRFKAVIIVDADTEIDAHYLDRALPYFNDQRVSAIAGHATPRWKRHALPRWSMFFTAYRIRLFWILQWGMRYAQSWKYTSVSAVVPGFASMYRTSALQHIDITAPGLIIEDFNMTFELHHKRLGKIMYHPSVFAVYQDPQTLGDYVRQVRRWDLGFWQTVRRHGIWPSFFWLSTGVFIVEMLISSVFFVTFPIIFGWLLATAAPEVELVNVVNVFFASILRLIIPLTLGLPLLIPAFIVLIFLYIERRMPRLARMSPAMQFFRATLIYGFVPLISHLLISWLIASYAGGVIAYNTGIASSVINITMLDILIGILVIDYILTIFVAIVEQKPILLIYGLGFVFLRYIDSFMYLLTLPLSFIVRSEGIWRSPARQAT